MVMAGSVFGDEHFKQSWRATSNGLEGASAMANDSLLALDEISECDPKEIGAVVYALANGSGKQRANKNGGAYLYFYLLNYHRKYGTHRHLDASALTAHP
jgi:putative DNA primase/helicase